MSETPRWRRYLRFWGPDPAAEVDDELGFHLEMRERDLIASGMAPAAARTQAEREFGDVNGVRAACVTIDERQRRHHHQREVVGDMLHDLRYAVRSLRKSPGFTLAAVLSIGLGIGACTTIFSEVDAVILRALPFHDADRLMTILSAGRSDGGCNPAPGEYLTLHRDAHSFSSVGAWFLWDGTLAGPEQAERLSGFRLTPSLFATLGVHAALGRTFIADSTSPDVAREIVLSDQFWRDRFAADPSVVGSTVNVSGEPYTVVGVMPTDFAFPQRADVWLPLTFAASDANDYTGRCWLRVVARLAPGTTTGQAQRELGVISARLAAAYPKENGQHHLTMQSLSDNMLHNLRRSFVPLIAAVGFVLLIVCANVANLTLVRASGRHRELAVRSSLGASRWRIVRELFTESVLIAGGGAVFGALMAWWAVPFIRDAVPQNLSAFLPGWEKLAVHPRALVVSAALALLAALLFGLLPALRAARPNLGAALRGGGREVTSGRGTRVRGALVVTEFALALVLLVGAGLTVQSFANLVEVDTGLHADHVLTMSLQLPAERYGEVAERGRFYAHVRSEVGALPGVMRVAAVSDLPLSHWSNMVRFNVSGRPSLPVSQEPMELEVVVTPGYFRTMSIPLLRGRGFTARDGAASSRVAIVSQAMARRYWPGVDPLGQRIDIDSMHYEVVGVAGDVRQLQMEQSPPPLLYRTEAQMGYASLNLVVQATRDASLLTNSVRRTIATIDRNVAISNIRTMPEVRSDYLAPWRLLMDLLGALAFVALVIATVGIYGVMAYTVVQRTHEIGIRMALGAGRTSVLRMVLGRAIVLIAVGLVLGVLGALGTTRALAFLLYGVNARDPAILVSVATLLALVTLLASWIPARRATKVDPLVAMRAE